MVRTRAGVAEISQPAQVAGMPEVTTRTAASTTELSEPLPEVRIEWRQGGRTTSYVVPDLGFLVGTVPGCDLRVPGANLPPVLALISRSSSVVTFRKLAPTHPVLINGNLANQAVLAHGDRMSLAGIELVVHIETPGRTSARAAVGGQARVLIEAGQIELQKKIEKLQDEVRLFQKEKELFERKYRERTRELDLVKKQLEDRSGTRPVAPQKAAEPIENAQALDARIAEVEREKQELASLRQELADIRRQLYDRYQERRDRLAGLQEAVNRAARKVQESKRQLESDHQELAERRRQDALRQEELEARARQLATLVSRLDEERRLFEETKSRLQGDMDSKEAAVKDREEQLACAQRELEERQKQYESDLVRLDRLKGAMEEQEKQLQSKASEIEKRYEQLQRDSEELEKQVAQFEEMRVEIDRQTEELARQKEEQEDAATQLAQRAAALEGQQATLAALRTRLERMREDVRREEQILAEQRARQETAEAELQQQLQEAIARRAELDAERKQLDEERQQMNERGTILEAAVYRVRQAQEKIAGDEKRLQQRAMELEQKAAEHAEIERQIQARLGEIEESCHRLESDRQILRDRTQALTQAEQAREKLQEQLRRRSEELVSKQQALADQGKQLEARAAEIDAARAELDKKQAAAAKDIEARHLKLEEREKELEIKRGELREKEEKINAGMAQLQEEAQRVNEQRHTLAEEQVQSRVQRQEAEEAMTRQRTIFEKLRSESRALMQQLPDLELRAGTALERLAGAREQLREQLGEVHAYARQCQEDLEAVRAQVQSEADMVLRQEQALRRAQDEHRLAVASFRQHLIDWQAQVADKKRVLAQDETLLDRKQAQVAEQARQIDETSQQLAQKADHLQKQERVVASRRLEMEGHLADMREWYRKKLRELSGVDDTDLGPGTRRQEPAKPVRAQAVGPEDDEPITPLGRNILSMGEPADGADRKLGELLRSLELVDQETLTALLAEARRQRRTLRQVLLSSGVVTLYQLALIEAGNVDGLMIGPVRVVDRLRVTSRETVYRVFDPRRGKEAILRLLSDSAMDDALHPDEFRQRFGRSIVDHPNLARTQEVLEISGRPAVLQEWLYGFPSSELPPLAAVPGVCYRLLMQAAQGLRAIHQAGLVHGHLNENLLLLMSDGTLKICGLGEPPWLCDAPYPEPGSVADDLAALGRIAAGWCISGVRKGSKTKAMPKALLHVLERLHDEGNRAYPDATALIADLERIAPEVPANAEAWDRLIRFVRENAHDDAALRQSA
jgi:chromosome segregation ATPase